ncbi:MAG: ABC transporter ATP-binding protein [Amaricoccus sp.]
MVRRAAEAALTATGIAHLADRRFPEVSGGERQMALIARALAQEPGRVVMDEPTARLDFGNQARVLARIGAPAARGIAVVLSPHDPGHAFTCATRVALMRRGPIIAAGTPDAILTPEALRDLYGVEVAVAYVAAAGRTVCAPSL